VPFASTGTASSVTVDATVTPTLLGAKSRFGSLDYACRITAHTAGTALITVDALADTLAAGTTTVIYQDEYTLASDLGDLYEGGLWVGDGTFVPLWSLTRLLSTYPDPPSGQWPPSACARLTNRLIRLSHYPTSVERVEYHYATAPADPSGTGDLIIPQRWRWVLSDGALYFAYLLKSDKRAGSAKQEWERAIQMLYEADRRMRYGTRQAAPSWSGPYR